MDENVHNGDEYFKKAYKRMEEEPSPEVWEKINAKLDNDDAVYYRGKFVTWKRIACLLLLLLSTTILYEVFTSKKQNPASVSVASKTTADNYETKPSGTQLTDDSLAQQQTKKITDTNYLSKHDKQSSRMESKIHHSDHRQPYLSAQDLAENKSNGLPVTHETPESLSRTEQSLKNQNNNLIFQRQQPASNPSDWMIGEQAQIIKLPRDDWDNYQSRQITAGAGNNRQEDNTGPIALLVRDAPGITINPASFIKNKANARSQKSSAGNWTITPFASADFTGYELDDDDKRNSTNQNNDKQDIANRESHQFSFSAGALAKWQFSPGLSLRTGLVYSNIAIGIQPQTLYATQDNNQGISYKFITSSGYAYVKPVFGSSPAAGDSVTSEIAHHHLQFLSVPLALGYKLAINKRLSVVPGVGLSANRLLSTKVRTEINEDTNEEMVVINKLQGLRKTYFSFMADAEVDYFISRHIGLSLLPAFKYALNPITKDNVVRTFPYSISIGAGLMYKF